MIENYIGRHIDQFYLCTAFFYFECERAYEMLYMTNINVSTRLYDVIVIIIIIVVVVAIFTFSDNLANGFKMTIKGVNGNDSALLCTAGLSFWGPDKTPHNDALR